MTMQLGKAKKGEKKFSCGVLCSNCREKDQKLCGNSVNWYNSHCKATWAERKMIGRCTTFVWTFPQWLRFSHSQIQDIGLEIDRKLICCYNARLNFLLSSKDALPSELHGQLG